MPAPFKASLITPEAIVLETPVTYAQVPAYDGLVGILDKRSPLLARLSTGVLRLDTAGAGGSKRFVVTGGYAQMKGDELTILTTDAIPAEKVTAQIIAAEQTKLAAIQGTGKVEMEQRQALQARIHAMQSVVK